MINNAVSPEMVQMLRMAIDLHQINVELDFTHEEREQTISALLIQAIISQADGVKLWNEMNRLAFEHQIPSESALSRYSTYTCELLRVNHILIPHRSVHCIDPDTGECVIFEVTIEEAPCEYCGRQMSKHSVDSCWYDIDPLLENIVSSLNATFIDLLFDGNSQSNMISASQQRAYLTPFVGSGLSAPFGIPTWAGLLYSLKSLVPKAVTQQEKKKNLRTKFEKFYKSNDVYGMLEIIKQIPKFRDDTKLQFELKNQIHKIQQGIDSKNVTNNLSDVFRIANGLIVSTNYDTLLEEVAEETYQSTSWDNFEGFGSTRETRLIFHLHGSIRSAHDMVITKSQYDRLYVDHRDSVNMLFADKHFVFLGFSMNDIDVREELAHVNKLNGGLTEHYLLTIEDSLSEHKDDIPSNVLQVQIRKQLWKHYSNSVNLSYTFNDGTLWYLGIHVFTLIVQRELYLNTD